MMTMVMPFGFIELPAVVAQIVFVHSHFPVITGNLVSFISHFVAVAVHIAVIFISTVKLCL